MGGRLAREADAEPRDLVVAGCFVDILADGVVKGTGLGDAEVGAFGDGGGLGFGGSSSFYGRGGVSFYSACVYGGGGV